MLNSELVLKMPAVAVFHDRTAMGAAAAKKAQEQVARQVSQHGRCRVIVGCAPSQDELFTALVREAQAAPEVWRKVELFHMDDYIGLTADHPQSFRYYLQKHFLDHVAVGTVHFLQGEAVDITRETRRYGALLKAAPIDLICLGFGENGHLAFNDPPVADFKDPVAVKVVKMDAICRQQQVNDGCFPSIDAVPDRALTITLPVFAGAGMLCGVVPSLRKAAAVKAALTGPIGEACPASLLRLHPHAHLFLDKDSASLLPSDYPLTTPAA